MKKSKHTIIKIIPALTVVITILDYLEIFKKNIFTIESRYILILSFLFLITPYLIDALLKFNILKQPKKIVKLFSSNNIIGDILAWTGSLIFVVLIIGITIASNFFGVGTKSAKSIFTQLNWPIYAERTWCGYGGTVKTDFLTEYKGNRNTLKLQFDVRKPNSYAGWLVTFGDLGKLQKFAINSKITFFIYPKTGDCSKILFGLKDKYGQEVKFKLTEFIDKQFYPITNQWRGIEIDLTSSKFSLLDLKEINNVSFSFEYSESENTNLYYELYLSSICFWSPE